MINLRYHIVSLTAVFLAIGIGLTLGSTFLDRATVENLNGQLDNLQQRLGERDERIAELESELSESDTLQEELDEQAMGLLADRLAEVPVVVLASRGVDEGDVRGATQALVVAGADMEGLWWFTDRWALDDQAEIDDLASALDATTNDPSRLRRMAIDQLGGDIQTLQTQETDPTSESPDDETSEDTTPEDTTPEDTTPEDTTPEDTTPEDSGTADTSADDAADADAIELISALIESGFIEFEAVPGGPETPEFAPGTRLLVVGGSTSVPDDLVVEPLLSRLARASTTPVLAVASSAMEDDGQISDLVSVIRQDERLSELVSTVDDLEHFDGWAAVVLALADVGETATVGHYGVDETASRLFPPLQEP